MTGVGQGQGLCIEGSEWSVLGLIRANLSQQGVTSQSNLLISPSVVRLTAYLQSIPRSDPACREH
jgi:hypothetical protein